MGAGSSAMRRAGGGSLKPNPNADPTDVPAVDATGATRHVPPVPAAVPLSSEERVAPVRGSDLPPPPTPPPATSQPAPAPAPPTSGHTSNPRQQRLTAGPPSPAAAALMTASQTPLPAPPLHRQDPLHPHRPSPFHDAGLAVEEEEESPPATPPQPPSLSAYSADPPAVVDTCVKAPPAGTDTAQGTRAAPAPALALFPGAAPAPAASGGGAAAAAALCEAQTEGDNTFVIHSSVEEGQSTSCLSSNQTAQGPAAAALRVEGVEEEGSGADDISRRGSSPKPSPSPDAPTADAAPLTGAGVDYGTYRPVTRSASPGAALGQYDGLPLTSVQQALQARHQVYRICLTGGPCAGKSTMLSAIQAKIPQRTGFRVMCVPEAATLLVTGGMQWDGRIAVPQQLALLRTQLALEDQFYALAVAAGVPTIIVSDRGTMDGRAFCSDAQFQEILRGVGSTIDVLRDRYDAVIHMVTAAHGAEEYYNLDNPARYEDLDGARASDLRLQEMYVGHPMFRLLDNSTTFDDKIERGLQVVGQVVHQEQCAPATPTYYLVRRCPATLPVASATYTAFTTVLGHSQMNDIRLLVRREMADGSMMHFFKSVRESPSAGSMARSMRSPPQRGSLGATSTAAPMQQRIESAQRISSREYASLHKHRDQSRAEVVMEATHFIFEGANYELTTLLAPSWAAGRQTLTVESCTVTAAAAAPPPPASPSQAERHHSRRHAAPSALRLPPFLEVDREVPVESLTTTFLISHTETGPLYTSLAFAPVFSRAVVSAIGAHADSHDILNSTLSTPRDTSVLRAETSALLASPVALEGTAPRDEGGRAGNAGAEAAAPAGDNPGTATAPPPLRDAPVPSAPTHLPPPPQQQPVRRGLAALDPNALPTAPASALVSVHAKGSARAQPLKTVATLPSPAASPQLEASASLLLPRRSIVTPSRFSLSCEDGDTNSDVTATAAVAEAYAMPPAGEHQQPDRPTITRDPESILPPIAMKKASVAAAASGMAH